MSPSGLAQNRPAWQMPPGGLKEHELDSFRGYIRRDMQHMIWQGPATTRPIFPLRGVQVAAVRVAWALAHPGEIIPLRLFQVCEETCCISPECYRGKKVKKLEHDETLHDQGGMPSVPRIIEAMGAIQFGLEVSPRPLRKLVVRDEDTLTTPEGDVKVQHAPQTVAVNPNPTEVQLQATELTVDQVLTILSQPDTVLMTFKTGHTILSTPSMRLDGYTVADVLQAALRRSGRVQVRG